MTEAGRRARLGPRSSPERALEAVRDRRDRTYDPALADLFAEHGRTWFEQLSRIDPWDAVLELEPTPLRTITGPDLETASLVVADFIDLKSPAMGGHSRRCAGLAARAADLLGLEDDDTHRLRRAALIHELGMTAIPSVARAR